jgi:hypothetical protein
MGTISIPLESKTELNENWFAWECADSYSISITKDDDDDDDDDDDVDDDDDELFS